MRDLISRPAAIDIINVYAERLDSYIGTSNDSEVYAYARGLLLSIERNIRVLPSVQPEQRWVPCSERPPEDKTAYYLATVANRGSFFSTTLKNNVDRVRWDYDRRKGQDSWHWCTERTVIAWMPLPEEYQAERRTDEL